MRLFFQGAEHDGFLRLTGTAHVTTDAARIDAPWNPILATWFTGGREDPRITAIGVKPQGGYYWDSKHGRAMTGIKMLVGMAIGKTLDDSVEGRLRP